MSSELKAVVAKSQAEVEAFRATWQQWQTHPDNEIDNFLQLARTRKNILRPHVVVVFRENQLVTLVVCRLERATVDFALGYKTLRGPVVNSLTVPYGGVLGECDEATAALILETLSKRTSSERVDRISFHYLAEGSPILTTLEGSNQYRRRLIKDDWTLHWDSDLTPDVEAFWSKLSRKHRMFLRRVAKNLEQAFPGKVNYSALRTEGEAASLCDKMEEVAKKTYLRGMGRGFVRDDQHSGRLLHAAKHGRLRAFLLQIGDRPISYAVGSVYDGRYILAYTAYDPELHSFDVGQLIIMNAIESLCREGVQKFDFGFGTALYKERLGDTCRRERSLHVYSPAVRAVVLVGVLRVFGGGNALARCVFSKLGVLKFAKQYWRKRLAQGQMQKPEAPAKASREASEEGGNA